MTARDHRGMACTWRSDAHEWSPAALQYSEVQEKEGVGLQEAWKEQCMMYREARGRDVWKLSEESVSRKRKTSAMPDED